MKSYFREIAGLALVFFLNHAAPVLGDSFVEDEERLYRMAVERQLAAPREELVNAGSPDKKAIRFALSVYGEYFGSSGIRVSLDYCLYLKKQNLEASDEFRLVQSRIKAWGRKSALAIIADPAHFSGPDKDRAFDIAEDIEGERWGNFQKDALYLKTASFWNEISKLEPVVAVDRPALSIEKVIVGDNGELNVGIHNGGTIVAKAGRATATKGKLAGCDISFFTDMPVEEIKKSRFSSATTLDNGFGKRLIAWDDGGQHGLVQVIRGNRQNNGVELFILKSAEFERPLMGNSIKFLSDDDLSVLTLRGKGVVDDHARGIDYQNNLSLSRFGSRLDATRLQGILKEKNGDIHDLEPFLVIYANSLPDLPDEKEYKVYNDILRHFKQ